MSFKETFGAILTKCERSAGCCLLGTVKSHILLGGIKTLGGMNISEKLANSLPETESVRGDPKALGGMRPGITTSRNIRETKDSEPFFRRIRREVPQKQKPLGGIENR